MAGSGSVGLITLFAGGAVAADDASVITFEICNMTDTYQLQGWALLFQGQSLRYEVVVCQSLSRTHLMSAYDDEVWFDIPRV